ncbi:hypothetical protein SODALDRAFT_303950 [Sodiomyces alkalinus F11]|uniref:Metallo-beta-lactamase domain-containing protein n=1 Tax=Sodiomyces alkalinus (strain CBS 110278 / VKM F-3762 / F11) TaxID=1314773 RepID=A0A3N2Q762_SODAK|nr:hypothetical protein SODALDRAFT_303950 [Sodiomyces alkalinus F11]ROT42556.1 hypothetical protein SODALDRAFT_303950 [Sodiomyces alkalinus F11]
MRDSLKSSFATPLPQSSRSEVLEWSFPKPYHQNVLTGKSRAAWHTSFVIPQMNLLLDAGLCVNKLRPKHIFVTHGHSDHTLLSPAFTSREDPPDIFCPAEMATAFDDFILASAMLDAGGLIGIQDAAKRGLDVEGEHESHHRSPSERAWLNTHVTHGVCHGDVIPLRRLKGITATVFDCDHSVPSVGYVFSTTTHRLRPEYSELAGSQIRDLRQSGVEITAPHTAPIFAFLGDTTVATLAADPPWLRDDGIPVVITECSFLYEEHREQAEKTKHTYWGDLEKVIRKWPKTTFVLMHFSMRYSDKDICEFFKGLEDPPTNMVVWIDGESS